MRISRLIATTFLLGGILLGSTAWAEDAVRYSGFLDHYPDLKQHPDGSGGLIYEKAGIDHCSYDKIMIEPIEVWMAADSKYKGFSPNVLTAITDELYRSLVINLEPDYPVVGSFARERRFSDSSCYHRCLWREEKTRSAGLHASRRCNWRHER